MKLRINSIPLKKGLAASPCSNKDSNFDNTILLQETF